MLRLLRLPLLASAALILANCAGKPAELAMTPAPEPVPVLAEAPPAVSPINAALSPAATAWHLRVALNVAALACRGPQELVIVADYNALLTAQRGALTKVQTALAAEYRARGGNWQDAYDDAMTRLYNFFSQAQAREAFCIAAGQVLAETRGLPADAFPSFAQARLAAVDAPFARAFGPVPQAAPPVPATVLASTRTRQPAPARRPVIAIAAAAPAVPPRARTARVAATEAPAPRLTIDIAALGD